MKYEQKSVIICLGPIGSITRKANSIGQAVRGVSDTVHEMAKDEARHGKALKGLLERYFAAELIGDDIKAKVDALAKKLGM